MASLCPAGWHDYVRIIGATAGLLVCAGTASAQLDTVPEPVVTPLWPTGRFLSGRSLVELELDRPDQPGQHVAVLIGNLDVSAVLERDGNRLRYHPGEGRLPAGESEVTAYLVTGDQWVEIGRFPLKVRNSLGLDRGAVLPSLDLSSTGQLDQGGTEPVSDRRTYQDLTLRIALESELAQAPWRIATQGNAIAVSNEEQRLRYGDMESAAPALDLSDYRVTVARGGTELAVGNVSAGRHRYLLDGFGSRGAVAQVGLGPAARLEAGLVHGTNVVGWDNLLGMGEPSHRIASATLQVDLVPSRPGRIQLSLSGMDGSVLPRTDFNQGAATDAEESRGLGAQVSISDARQRIRFSGGVARSRFVNPNDPLLSDSTELVAVRPTTRNARYGELQLVLLEGLSLSRGIQAGLVAAARHERVDPLYRTVGASPASDIENNGLDLTGSFGPLALQAAVARSRDNLADLGSVLTSHTRSTGLSAALPLGSLVGRSTEWLFPQISYSWQRARQFGEGVPENGEFSESHVPDQVNLNQTGSLTWTVHSAGLSYRWNQSFQDNRQTGREQADFLSTVHALTFTAEPVARIAVSLDLGIERHRSIETSVTQNAERIGGSFRWPVTSTTELSGTVAHAWALDPGTSVRRRNTELQLEASQGLSLYRNPKSGTQGRLFVRFGRSRAVSLGGIDPSSRLVAWTLNAGGSFRLY